MYGFADCFVIYGWQEGDRNVVLTEAWLDAEGIELYASDMVRNTAGNAIYGVRCDFDGNGAVQVSNELRDKVKMARDKVVAMSNGIIINIQKQWSTAVPELQFHLGMQGDFDWNCHGKYTPGVAPVMPDYEAVRRGREDGAIALGKLFESQRMMERFGGRRW